MKKNGRWNWYGEDEKMNKEIDTTKLGWYWDLNKKDYVRWDEFIKGEKNEEDISNIGC
tara:strand:+ start:102 stop:275 length:174 start_codon:yes stop_codon:yes gene_type:complete